MLFIYLFFSQSNTPQYCIYSIRRYCITITHFHKLYMEKHAHLHPRKDTWHSTASLPTWKTCFDTWWNFINIFGKLKQEYTQITELSTLVIVPQLLTTCERREAAELKSGSLPPWALCQCTVLLGERWSLWLFRCLWSNSIHSNTWISAFCFRGLQCLELNFFVFHFNSNFFLIQGEGIDTYISECQLI